jgi:hypothetical protein
MRPEINISWAWEDAPVPHLTFKMKVHKIRKTSTGFLGYKKLSRYIDYLPNSKDMLGICISDDNYLDGKTIMLTLPDGQAKNIKTGDVVSLGIADFQEKMYCVSITPNP